MGDIREGRWDCDQCESQRLLGRYVYCPGCGKPRGKNVHFYLLPGSPVVESQEQLEIAHGGPDWNCEYCDTANRNNFDWCTSCGAARGESTSNPVITHNDDGLFIHDSSSDEPRPQGHVWDGITFAHTPLVDAATPYLVGGVIVAFLALFLGWLFIPRTVQATVTSMPWDRTIDIQVYRTVREQGWGVPSGGREIMHETVIRDYDHPIIGYDTVTTTEDYTEQDGTEACGQIDRGNGYFEEKRCPKFVTKSRPVTRQEPVRGNVPIWDTQYTYEIERWLADHTEEAKGNGGQPYWPTFSLIENQREGDKGEQYTVVFTDMKKPEKTYSHISNQEEWQTFEIGQEVTLTVNRIGGVRQIER